MIKLLALDLDGTLLIDMHTISAPTQVAIKAALEHGVYVTIATGREYGITEKFVHQLGLTAPVICFQGGLIYAPLTQETIASDGLSLPLAYRLIDIARTQELALSLFLAGRVYAEHVTEQSRTLYRDIGSTLVEVSDLKQVINTPPLKGMVVHPVEQRDEIMFNLQNALNGSLSVFRSHDVLTEITSLTVSKGHALATLAAYYGLDQSQVMAIGDQDNDVEMIDWAGIGVAMGNASPKAKAVADYIAPPVTEDGVAWAIETFILGHIAPQIFA